MTIAAPAGADRGMTARAHPWLYHVYGVRVRSEWPLPYPERSSRLALGDISISEGAPPRFRVAAAEAVETVSAAQWFHHAQLRDGTLYLRWAGLFEFLVSADGSHIAVRKLGSSSAEGFYTYLLGQVLSFALIRQGFDPLHATTVTVGGNAVAFLGDSGYGKSSLAAAFIQAGHRLLTDDLLVLTEEAGGFLAHPGPPRIKLFPETARLFVGARPAAAPMNDFSPKLVISLEASDLAAAASPLKAFYLLPSPGMQAASSRVRIRRLAPRRAWLALARNTFNSALTDAVRLERQFGLAAGIAARVPVKLLSYRRDLRLLPMVRDAILADLAR